MVCVTSSTLEGQGIRLPVVLRQARRDLKRKQWLVGAVGLCVNASGTTVIMKVAFSVVHVSICHEMFGELRGFDEYIAWRRLLP